MINGRIVRPYCPKVPFVCQARAGQCPELRTSKGTIQLRPSDAEDIADAELRDLVRTVLDG